MSNYQQQKLNHYTQPQHAQQHAQYQQQQQQQQQQHHHVQQQYHHQQQQHQVQSHHPNYHQKPRYGPPHNIKPRQYNIMLEMLESKSNKILTQEYENEILETLSNLEIQTSVNSSMIDLQPEIQWFMRPFLIDFLIELHSSFKLQPNTLFLCMNIIDRYCAKRIVFKRHYQLVGCTALWIASKYEDKKSRVPTLKELTIMCRSAYDENMFVQMEMHILGTLEWSIGHPTLEDCLQLSIKQINVKNHSNIIPYKCNLQNQIQNQILKNDSNTNSNLDGSTLSAVTAIGRFLCELSMYDKYLLDFPISLIAISSNLLACSMLQIPNASNNLKNLIEKHIIDPKRNLLIKQYKLNHQKNLQNLKQHQQHQQNQQRPQLHRINQPQQSQFKIPKFPLKLSNINNFYHQNNESNYSHQSNIMRHSSIDDDIDLDSEEDTDNDDEKNEDDEDYVLEYSDQFERFDLYDQSLPGYDDEDEKNEEFDDNENNEFNDTNNTTIEDDDESDSDSESEEIENKFPEIIGSFLNGFDENNLIVIKKISLILILNLSKVTEVLNKKYESLGVIQVLKNFNDKNYKLIKEIHEFVNKQSMNQNNNGSNQTSSSQSPSHAQLSQPSSQPSQSSSSQSIAISNILNNFEQIDKKIINSIENLINYPKNLSNPNDFLKEFEINTNSLNLSSTSSLMNNSSFLLSSTSTESEYSFGYQQNHLQIQTPKSTYPFNSSSSIDSIQQQQPPITPPSATSQYSIFSNKKLLNSSNSSSTSTTNLIDSNSKCNESPNTSGFSNLLKTKSKIRKKLIPIVKNNNGVSGNGVTVVGNNGISGNGNDSDKEFSPIKPIFTSSSLNNSSPLMHQNF
ncbi:uncharacterized protein KGF55_002118 [Candida pseudojiufengensis]|uniref:uncharacterized protein n=1 Tax=Candida pseudojiufengensis TaxID=497109 RepID=UPI002224A1AC|nr:uncharacterized protein KGF55_002118 [Candida pseudojiufengensis]KAI5964176.1 hypothetical protein KGF55_002118 [Candida pseudojiufengensis]